MAARFKETSCYFLEAYCSTSICFSFYKALVFFKNQGDITIEIFFTKTISGSRLLLYRCCLVFKL